MSDAPHGRLGHLGVGCQFCPEPEHQVFTDPDLGRIEKLQSSSGSMAMTNGHFGGWTTQRDGSYISIEAAKAMNRAQRRKLGIVL